MSMPMRQNMRLDVPGQAEAPAAQEFPLLLELEPLFACNLKCAGCGKIATRSLLKQRMPVEQAVAAVKECGAPMVSIAAASH